MSFVGLDYEEQLLEKILEQLDVKISTIAGDIKGTGGKTLTDIYNVESNINAQISKLTFDTSNRLYVNAAVVSNPSNLDVALSTRASESTLSSLNAKFPTAQTFNPSSPPQLGTVSTTVITSILYGFSSDLSKWVRIGVDSSGNLLTKIISMPSLPSGTNIIGGVFADYSSTATIDQQVGTTEVVGSAVDVRRRGRKVVFMKNTQDVSVTVTIEGSYDGVNWFTIRDGIVIDAGQSKIGVVNDAYGYIRAKAVASGSPTSGAVTIVVSSMT